MGVLYGFLHSAQAIARKLGLKTLAVVVRASYEEYGEVIVVIVDHDPVVRFLLDHLAQLGPAFLVGAIRHFDPPAFGFRHHGRLHK